MLVERLRYGSPADIAREYLLFVRGSKPAFGLDGPKRLDGINIPVIALLGAAAPQGIVGDGEVAAHLW